MKPRTILLSAETRRWARCAGCAAPLRLGYSLPALKGMYCSVRCAEGNAHRDELRVPDRYLV